MSDSDEVLQPAVRGDGGALGDDYRLEVKCSNCGHRASIRLPKGRSLADAGPPCLNCGCLTVERA